MDPARLRTLKMDLEHLCGLIPSVTPCFPGPRLHAHGTQSYAAHEELPTEYGDAEDEEAFHAALDANPEDHTTRQVFADWLEERGDPRAAGYRALGMLGRRPQSWWPRFWWHRGDHSVPGWSRMNVENTSVLPHDWLNRIRPTVNSDDEPDGNTRRGHETRRHAEDAAAHAFSQLHPDEQQRILQSAQQQPQSENPMPGQNARYSAKLVPREYADPAGYPQSQTPQYQPWLRPAVNPARIMGAPGTRTAATGAPGFRTGPTTARVTGTPRLGHLTQSFKALLAQLRGRRYSQYAYLPRHRQNPPQVPQGWDVVGTDTPGGHPNFPEEEPEYEYTDPYTTAQNWHSGQWSGLYRFGSGAEDHDTIDDALSEVERNLRNQPGDPNLMELHNHLSEIQRRNGPRPEEQDEYANYSEFDMPSYPQPQNVGGLTHPAWASMPLPAHALGYDDGDDPLDYATPQDTQRWLSTLNPQQAGWWSQFFRARGPGKASQQARQAMAQMMHTLSPEQQQGLHELGRPTRKLQWQPGMEPPTTKNAPSPGMTKWNMWNFTVNPPVQTDTRQGNPQAPTTGRPKPPPLVEWTGNPSTSTFPASSKNPFSPTKPGTGRPRSIGSDRPMRNARYSEFDMPSYPAVKNVGGLTHPAWASMPLPAHALGYGELTASKASEILHDGTAHGHSLTDKQRRFMGWKSHQTNHAAYAMDYDLDEQRAFEAHLDANPNDHVARRAYADWLRENGAARQADEMSHIAGVGGEYPGMVARATQPRGSWRWQDAFSVSRYLPSVRQRDRQWMWRKGGTISRKLSDPQVRRIHGDLPETPHNSPLTVQQMLAQGIDPDRRYAAYAVHVPSSFTNLKNPHNPWVTPDESFWHGHGGGQSYADPHSDADARQGNPQAPLPYAPKNRKGKRRGLSGGLVRVREYPRQKHDSIQRPGMMPGYAAYADDPGSPVDHPEGKQFVDHIRANPDDATTRRVFADWLDEHGYHPDMGKLHRIYAGQIMGEPTEHLSAYADDDQYPFGTDPNTPDDELSDRDWNEQRRQQYPYPAEPAQRPGEPQELDEMQEPRSEYDCTGPGGLPEDVPHTPADDLFVQFTNLAAQLASVAPDGLGGGQQGYCSYHSGEPIQREAGGISGQMGSDSAYTGNLSGNSLTHSGYASYDRGRL